MKALNIVMRVLLILVLLLPILGVVGVFPAPTADLYSPAGWAFMQALMNTGYMMMLIGLVAFVGLILVVMGRTALAAVILAPFTVNVICFHLFLDKSFFSPSAIPAWLLLIPNVYFLWVNSEKYKKLW